MSAPRSERGRRPVPHPAPPAAGAAWHSLLPASQGRRPFTQNSNDLVRVQRRSPDRSHFFRPRPRGAQSMLASANRARRAKALRNIPSAKDDEFFSEVIQVLDPRHPLYGRSFRVICRSPHKGGNFPPSYEVEHRGGTSLLVPVAATEPSDLDATRPKLSIESLNELISAVECLESDEHRSERSLGNAALGSTPTDRRRHCRSSGGDVS